MKKQILTTYEWWNSDRETPVKEEHKEILEENALGRIEYLSKDGFTSGQLIAEIEDEETGKEYSYEGYFSVEECNFPTI